MSNKQEQEKKVIKCIDEDNPVYSQLFCQYIYSKEELEQCILDIPCYENQSVLRLRETKKVFLEEIDPNELFSEFIPKDQSFGDVADGCLVMALEKLNEAIRNHRSVAHIYTDQDIFIEGVK